MTNGPIHTRTCSYYLHVASTRSIAHSYVLNFLALWVAMGYEAVKETGEHLRHHIAQVTHDHEETLILWGGGGGGGLTEVCRRE